MHPVSWTPDAEDGTVTRRGTLATLRALGCDTGSVQVDGLDYLTIKKRLGLLQPHESRRVSDKQRQFVGAFPSSVRPHPRGHWQQWLEPAIEADDTSDHEVRRFLAWIAARPSGHEALINGPALASEDTKIRSRAAGQLASSFTAAAEREASES